MTVRRLASAVIPDCVGMTAEQEIFLLVDMPTHVLCPEIIAMHKSTSCP
jgi:hypothetical protein